MEEALQVMIDLAVENTDSSMIHLRREAYQLLLQTKNNGKLYKYRSFDAEGYALGNLLDQTLYCADVDTFNDPFEYCFEVDFSDVTQDVTEQRLLRDSGIAKQLAKRIHNELKKLDAGCLTTSYTDSLMWSLYADGGKGFCVEYDFDSIYNSDCFPDRLEHLFPVFYSEYCPRIPSSYFGNVGEEKKKLELAYWIMLTKSKIWSYENEWRMIVSKDDDPRNKTAGENKGISVSLPISAIYLGPRIESHHKKIIQCIAKKNSIRVNEMTLDYSNYKYVNVN